MSDTGSGGDWLSGEWLWEGVKYVISAVVTIASSAMLWLATRYRGDRSMLLRHEERFNALDKELGDAKVFRHETIRDFEADMETLHHEDETLHIRVNKLEVANSERNGDIKAINENLAWIKKALERIEKK